MENDVIVTTAAAYEEMAALQTVRAEIDAQVATAHAYPRALNKCLDNIRTMATHDPETAAACFYKLRRGGTLIEGVSVRMAEIVASQWGNLRTRTWIESNDGKNITAKAQCLDLESNFGVETSVRRRITDKNGRTFTEDMQTTTANAAQAIAFRNAVFKVVPAAVIKRIMEEAKRVAMGQSLDMERARQGIITRFAALGADEKTLYEYLEIANREEMTKELAIELMGLLNAIKEGDTTFEEAFKKPLEEKRKGKELAAKAQEAAARAKAAKAGLKVAAQDVEPAAEEKPAEVKQEAQEQPKAEPAKPAEQPKPQLIAKPQPLPKSQTTISFMND